MKVLIGEFGRDKQCARLNLGVGLHAGHDPIQRAGNNGWSRLVGDLAGVIESPGPNQEPPSWNTVRLEPRCAFSPRGDRALANRAAPLSSGAARAYSAQGSYAA